MKEVVYDKSGEDLIKVFPNGFASWMETHHEVVAFMHYEETEGGTRATAIKERISAQGSKGLYELAEKWTDEFEQRNEGRVWDGEFFDEVHKFLDEKNKP